MPLTHMNDMLNHAYRHSYAIGAFNVSSLDLLKAVLAAAENCRAPVILNLPESCLAQAGTEMLLAAALAGAQQAGVPVALCLDHATSLESAVRGIRLGCNAIMLDATALPLDESLRCTRRVAEMAHACGVSIEGELGYVPWIEAEQQGSPTEDIGYTLPAEARAFVERTGVDCLAVSIGTVHGKLHGTPKLDLTRRGKIHAAIDIPLVIHGSTGLSDEQYRKLIAHGVVKFNYYTALTLVAGASIRQQMAMHPEGNLLQLTAGIHQAVTAHIEGMMRLWGSGGRAAEVLQQCRPWQPVTSVLWYDFPELKSASEINALLERARAALQDTPGIRACHWGSTQQANGKTRIFVPIHCASTEMAQQLLSLPACTSLNEKLLRAGATNPQGFEYAAN